MDTKTIILLLAVIQCTFCAYEDQQYKQQPQYKQQQQQQQQQQQPHQQQPLYRDPLYKQPPPRILSHKQAQNHDGGFKFAYTAENGLAHSEVIAPDGTRNGGYSYVDPHGKTISVKYTAGKDGFKILEGDHIPREPPRPAQPAAPVQPYHSRSEQQEQQSYQNPQTYSPPQIYQKPSIYQNPHPPITFKPQQKPTFAFVPPQPRNYAPPPVVVAPESPNSNSVEQKEPDYHDEPGKPYSFGVGYAFQFGS